MFDTHIHTNFSTDSLMDIGEAVKRSKELNMGLIITEHMDVNYPGGVKFNFNPEEYFKSFGHLRSDDLLLGIELGMHKDYKDINRSIIDGFGFDYVLGSLHFLGNNDVYEKETYSGRDKMDAYEQYFSDMLENIQLHEYIDSLGHIDYICRYAIYEDKEIYYKEFSEIIDDILKEIINKDIALEINTRRLTDYQAAGIITPVYRRYAELGGCIVTLGSDSHAPERIGENFRIALDIVREFNMKPVVFKERKAVYDNIGF